MFTIFDEEKETFVKVEEPDHSLTYTYADYLQWRYEERMELIRGKIFKMSPAPRRIHQQILMKLCAELYFFLKGNPCQVFPAPFDVRLPCENKKENHEITTVVQPDIVVVCDEAKLDELGCCGAPDLAVEILSRSNSKKDIRIKSELYEEAGVREYWIINPKKMTLTAYKLASTGKYESSRTYAEGDRLESYAVPGFTIEASEIFTR